MGRFPRRFAAWQLVAALATATAEAQAAAPLDDAPSPAGFVEEERQRAEVVGASVALVRSGEITWHGGFGVGDLRKGEAVTGDTAFAAASLGKVVAAYAALVLVESGVWSLDMPVRADNLTIPPGCEAPTLGQLLSHTAGLGNNLLASRFEPACHPPAPYSYAGQGFLALQALIEVQTGERADRFIAQRVFERLGMRHSTYVRPEQGSMATGYVDPVFALLIGGADRSVVATAIAIAVALAAIAFLVLRSLRRRTTRVRAFGLVSLGMIAGFALVILAAAQITVPTESWSDRMMLPSSLHTTALDQARFAIELMRPTLVRPETRDLLFAPLASVNDAIGWGAGIGIDRSVQPTTYWHWGSNPGFQALIVLEPVRGDAIVVLTNTGGGLDHVTGRRSGYEMGKRLARRLLGVDGRWDIR